MKIKKIAASLFLSAALIFSAGTVSARTDTPSAFNGGITAYADEIDDAAFDLYEEYADELDQSPDSAVSESKTEKEKKKFNPVKSFLTSLFISMLIALIVVLVMRSSLKTVHKKVNAADYKVRDSFHLDESDDSLIGRKVDKTLRAQTNK
jgi:hypothetical protein